MCNFGSLAVGGMGGGTLASTAGALQSSRQQSAMYDYQSKVASNNANIARQQAVQASEAGLLEEKQLQDKASRALGEGRASYGAGGVMLGTGSEADWEADTARAAASDQAVAKYNTKLKEWGFQNEANNYDAQSSMYSKASSNAKTSGWLTGTSSLLSGGGSTILAGYQLNKAGAFDDNWFKTLMSKFE